jgi:hypothetical protein
MNEPETSVVLNYIDKLYDVCNSTKKQYNRIVMLNLTISLINILITFGIISFSSTFSFGGISFVSSVNSYLYLSTWFILALWIYSFNLLSLQFKQEEEIKKQYKKLNFDFQYSIFPTSVIHLLIEPSPKEKLFRGGNISSFYENFIILLFLGIPPIAVGIISLKLLQFFPIGIWYLSFLPQYSILALCLYTFSKRLGVEKKHSNISKSNDRR